MIKTFEKFKGKTFIEWLNTNYPDKNKWDEIKYVDCSNQRLIDLKSIENLKNLTHLNCANTI